MNLLCASMLILHILPYLFININMKKQLLLKHVNMTLNMFKSLHLLYFFSCVKGECLCSILLNSQKEALNHTKIGNKFTVKVWINVPTGFLQIIHLILNADR